MTKNKKNGVDVMDETVKYEYTDDGSSKDENSPYMTYTPYELPTVGSYDDYFEEQKKKNMESVDEQATEYTEQNNQRAKSYNEQIDQSVATQEAVYRGGIVEAENDARQQYDENHINELIGRKNVERALANMGLTDSGLNLSQQTQLSVMRGNADAATRGTMAKRVQGLTDAINQAYIDAEKQKSAYRQGLDDEYNSWYRSATATAKQNAADTAASRVAADQEAAQSVMEMNNENFWKTSEYNRGVYEFDEKQRLEREKAAADAVTVAYKAETDRIKAETDRINASTKATTDANDAYTKQIRDYKDDRNSYYKSLVDNGMSDEDAWATAYTRYPLVAGEYGEKEKDAADRQNKYHSLYSTGIQNGYSGDEAATYANTYLSDEDVKEYYNGLSESEKETLGNNWENARPDAADKKVQDEAAKKVVKRVGSISDGLEVEGNVLAFWNSTFWHNKENDGKMVADTVKSVLSSSDWYSSLTETEKSCATDASIATCILNSFPNEPDDANMTRIDVACKKIPNANPEMVKEIYWQKKKK